MGKKTWILKLTDEQYDCIARGMEYYHRMMCGQVDVVDEVCKHRIDDALKMSLKNSMFPELLPSQSCGWNGSGEGQFDKEMAMSFLALLVV